MVISEQTTAGVIGLGLMGCSITTCFLISGYEVVALEPHDPDLERKRRHIKNHLDKAFEKKIINQDSHYFLKKLHLTRDYKDLRNCKILSENTLEDLKVKTDVLKRTEQQISSNAILTSNTSSIPITRLQEALEFPERFFGLHWMEPAHLTRFLEIICGEKSDPKLAQQLYETAFRWDKEPTLVKKDIRGFITNRLMYAMYREACSLVEGGYATVEDVDSAIRNSTGYWLTLFGIFQWMDMTGVKAYYSVMKDLFPTLNNQKEVPRLIDNIIKEGGNGISNGKGFYSYTSQEAGEWKEVFEEFSFKIRELALQFPSDIVSKRLEKKRLKKD